MSDVQETKTAAPAAAKPAAAPEKKGAHEGFRPKTTRRTPNNRSGRPGGRRPGGRKRFDRPVPEFDQKIVNIRRVTRVMAGGRRFSFSVVMIIGDRKGRVGIGVGKSPDTATAIQKALKDAKKNMITVATTKDMSIAHEITAKYDASEVWLMPNNGKGVVAGGSVRDILNFAGLKNVTGKILSRSKNQINNSRATVIALDSLQGGVKAKPAPKKDEAKKTEKTDRK